MKKIKKWICKTFWHKFNGMDLLIYQIKKSAINKKQLKHYIKCQRCGKIFN